MKIVIIRQATLKTNCLVQNLECGNISRKKPGVYGY